jgi:hypothetical protein
MEGFVPDYPITPFLEDMEPEEFRATIYGCANSQQIRWWRALISPAYNPRSGSADEKGKWLHEEQVVNRFRAAVSDGRTMKRYLPQGEIQSGDMTIVVMPDEIDLGDHDWVVCLGRSAAAPVPGVPPNAPLYGQKEALVRGANVCDLIGNVSSAGAVVTGIGTRFLTDFTEGSLIRAAGRAYRILTIASDSQMTVESPPSPAWYENDFASATESLLWWPVFDIRDLRDAQRTYVPGVDFTLGRDERTIVWRSGLSAPAPGATISAIYRYFPRYQVMGDQGLVNHAVRGVRLPSTFTMRLVRPDALTGG